MGREVYRLFRLHDAFEEYNSPTYYGTDIYALGLWQDHCSSTQLQRMGAEMEEALWRDIAQFYHAGLKNVAGPYDRAYGMDMRGYVALLGEWIWHVTGRENAPFPDLNGRLMHAGDFCFGPLVAIRAPRVPEDVIPHFLAFQGERWVEHVLGDSPLRSATAWLSKKAMIGAEHTSLRDTSQSQFHPATIHWQAGGSPGQRASEAGLGWPQVTEGRTGWVRLMTAQPVDAVASPSRLVVDGAGQLAFLLDAPGISAATAKPDHWHLPGLEVRVEASAPGVVDDAAGEQIVVRYAAEGAAGQAVHIVLQLNVE